MSKLYELTEQELYYLIRDNLYPDLVLIKEDTYSAVDCFSTDNVAYIELKCRRTHYNNLMIEKLKYDRIMNMARSTSLAPLYICSTPEGIWEFNLDFNPIEWTDRDDLPTTTDFNNKDRITKTVGYLSVDNGRKIIPWYPDFATEEEWIEDSLGNFAEDNWVDPAEIEYDLKEMEQYIDE